MPRYNTCPETAVTKAFAKLYPGMVLDFNQDANNDEQCDLNTLFGIIPGDDLTIDDPRLGGRETELKKAAQKAQSRAAAEVNPEQEMIRFVKLFETYLEEELASFMPEIESILIENIQKLDPGRVYVLRTGKIDEGGHFHTLFCEGSSWILDSGFKDAPSSIQSRALDESETLREPNIGLLFDATTNKLGPMYKSLVDISSNWGRASGDRMLCIYEMNRNRMLIAARYIEKFRELSKEDTEIIFEKEYLNEIISQPNYLDSFDQGGYWHASGTELTPISSREYIDTALEQCTRDLPGAVIQLQAQGFFTDDKKAQQLIIEMIVLNNFEVVKEILTRTLVDLSNPEVAQHIYKSAFEYSQTNQDCPPGLNLSLRILQNKLLEISPDNLPFTISDTCLTLNYDALQLMLSLNDEVNTQELILEVNKTAKACKSTRDTYQPLIDILSSRNQSTKMPELDSKIDNPENLTSRDLKPKRRGPDFFSPNAQDTKLIGQKNQSYNIDYLASELLAIIARTANEVWERARDILLDPNTENKTNPYDRNVLYTLTSRKGKEIKIEVSEQVQIAMDELYAKKLQEEEQNKSFRK
jgi:hypothetical protein